MKSMISLFGVLAFVQSGGSYAEGGYDVGNGGDTCERRIQEIRDDLSAWIQSGGAAGLKLSESVNLDQYNSKMLSSLSQTQVSCTQSTLHVESAEKTCKNFQDNQGQSRIVCNVEWFMQQTNESDQYILIHHEYAGLARFEVNRGEISDYTISNQISGFLENRIVKKLAIRPYRDVMTFVKINPGTFMMGSPRDEEYRQSDENPHPVKLSNGFEMQTTTVTQAQWYEVMHNNPSYFAAAEYCRDFLIKENTPMCPNHPVEQVTWYDVQNYLFKLNLEKKSEGYLYRLPTEAEWEYAARAGTKSAYFFGEDYVRIYDYAWYEENSGKQTQAVGQLKPNAWGLFDMSGNVWQWVSDIYGEYNTSILADPTGPTQGPFHLTRGASWRLNTFFLRVANRNEYTPTNKNYDLGFRLVRTR